MILNLQYYHYDDECSIVEFPDRIGEDIEELIRRFHKYAVSGQTCEEFYTLFLELTDDRIPPCDIIDRFIYWLNMYVCDENEKITVIKSLAPADPEYKTVKL